MQAHARLQVPALAFAPTGTFQMAPGLMASGHVGRWELYVLQVSEGAPALGPHSPYPHEGPRYAALNALRRQVWAVRMAATRALGLPVAGLSLDDSSAELAGYCPDCKAALFNVGDGIASCCNCGYSECG